MSWGNWQRKLSVELTHWADVQMNNNKISESLSALFLDKSIVFWHDVDGEFSASVDNLEIEHVQLVRLDETPALRIKLDVEREPNQRWLIYSNQPEPEPSKDWLFFPNYHFS